MWDTGEYGSKSLDFGLGALSGAGAFASDDLRQDNSFDKWVLLVYCL